MIDIAKIAKNRVVEEIARNIGVCGTDLDDLSQTVYLALLEMPPEKLDIPDKEINYYLTRVIKNQWLSNSSPYYRQYKRYYSLIDGNIDTPEDNDLDDDRYD